jgi:hypothetical protein
MLIPVLMEHYAQHLPNATLRGSKAAIAEGRVNGTSRFVQATKSNQLALLATA